MKHCSKMQIVKISILFSISFFLLAFTASAQNLSTGVNGLDLTASTNNPVPGQNVTITVRSYSIEINSAKISWSVNGIVKQNDIGATTLVVVAPALGKKLNISVTAITPSGGSISNNILVGSGSVDMLLESEGYVPPLFRGKVPPVYQSTVKIAAVPHIANSSGVEYDPKNLVYQWKKNGQVMEEDSGYGKQSVTIKGEMVPRPYSVTVTVSNRDYSAQAVGMISVIAVAPSLSFYVNDPLYGTLFNKAVNDTLRIGSQKETGVFAVPYGFSKYAAKDNLSLSWTINGMEHPELSTNQSVILRAPSDTGGTSAISLNISNLTDILQGTRSGFTASFSANKQNTSAPATSGAAF